MIAHRDAAERQHAAAQVVVDLLQQHRRARGHHGCICERKLVGLRGHEVRGRAFLLDRLVALEPNHDLRVGRVEDERTVREPDIAFGVVEEEVHPLGVVERALVDRHRVHAFEGLGRVGEPRRLFRGSGLLLAQCRLQRAAGDAGGRVAAGALHERIGELGDRERRDHTVDIAGLHQFVVEPRELLPTLGGEQLVDRVAFVHGDDGQHRLTAEQVLVRDVVGVDAVVLVQVAVLAGRELELGDAEAEHDGDEQPDHRDQAGALAEGHGEHGPEALHHRGTFPRAAKYVKGRFRRPLDAPGRQRAMLAQWSSGWQCWRRWCPS